MEDNAARQTHAAGRCIAYAAVVRTLATTLRAQLDALQHRAALGCTVVRGKQSKVAKRGEDQHTLGTQFCNGSYTTWSVGKNIKQASQSFPFQAGQGRKAVRPLDLVHGPFHRMSRIWQPDSAILSSPSLAALLPLSCPANRQ